jgi:hypothetical protein
MKTFNAIKTGLIRSVKAWKGIFIVWIFYLSFVSLLVIPMRSSMKSGFGHSMITEELQNGFNLEVFSDLDQVARSLMSSFSTGLLLAFVFGIIMNAFLSGGLFSSLKADAGRFSTADFFRASGRYFWKFLFITLIVSIVVLLFVIFILIVPVALVIQSEPNSEKVPFIVGIISGTVLLFLLLTLLLITDYARAWNAARDNPVCFKAIGFGLSRSFERFRSSFLLIFIITLIQMLLTALVIRLIGTWRPATGSGVFILFLASQVLFILRILIKIWRYGSVTNLMELNDKTPPAEVINL